MGKTAEISLKDKKSTKETSTKSNKEKVDTKNLENAKAKITKEKDLLYIYPSDISSLESRKKFRHEVRRHRASFEKKIAKAEKAERPGMTQAANEWAAGVYAKGHVPAF